MVTEVTTFLNEFGEVAIFNSASSVIVIFDNESASVLDIVTGGIMIAGPQAMARESDVPNPKGKTLKVNDVTYNIIEARPDGTGMTTLTLSKD